MEPQAIFDKFAARIFQISCLQRSTRKLIHEEADSLLQMKEAGGEYTSIEGFIYYRAADGAVRALKAREADVDQALLNCRFHKIKQYQWMLAEAYEALEDFLEESYAAGAMRTGSLWWLSDYGNVAPSDVDESNFQWLLERARRKKDRPFSIVERLRASSENFRRLEMEDATKANYRIALVLIEKLRHVIVHNNGYIDDLDAIVNKAVGQCGKDARFKAHMKEIFESYLELHDGRPIVCLLEVNVGKEDPIHRFGGYNDSLGQLLRLLVGFADLITETVESFGLRTT